MKYCKATTLEHPVSKKYPECLIDYNLVISNEGYAGTPVFTNNEIILNLDLVEELYSKELIRKEKNKSMDSAFCVINNDSKKVVLVEYKFNHQDFKFLRLADMVGKVAGSTEILAAHMPIHYRYYFVVQHDLINQAYRRFFYMNPKPGNEYIAISIELLKKIFF